MGTTSAALPPEDSERIESALKSTLPNEVSDTLETLKKKLKKEVPLITGRGDTLRLRRPDRRMQWGITRRGGVFTMALLVENDDSWALAKAEKMKQEQGAHVAVSVTGQAHSGKTANKLPLTRESKLRPGLSISHFGGWAGSLGCIVTNGGLPAIVGASHVLGRNNRASLAGDDWVIHPGIPDAPPLAGNRVGALLNFVMLAHYSNVNQGPPNTLDVGLARVDDSAQVPDRNWVANPEDPARRISLKGVLPAEELFAHLGESVFKVGRTTGFTAGALEFTNVHRYPIRLPDGRSYLYDDIACVASDGHKPFSRKGDSGAVVYLADGRAIGLVIGGSNRYTFLSPLSSCLDAVDAQLYGVS